MCVLHSRGCHFDKAVPPRRTPIEKTVGYDVTYRYDGAERTVRMDERPGERLPVVDGQVVTQVASAGNGDRG